MPICKTRGLMPQTVLNILNQLVMINITPCIDIFSIEHGLSNIILGGNKGSQPQDVTFAIAQALEKGRDRRNAAAVAQADVETCHDCIPWAVHSKVCYPDLCLWLGLEQHCEYTDVHALSLGWDVFPRRH